MKPELALWGGGTLYFLVIAALYAAVGGDVAGVALLVLAGGLGGLVGGWIWAWRRTHPAPRPQDLGDADAADEVGVVGSFPSASLRPLALGAGLSIAALGVVLGSWMTVAGVAVVASQVALLVRDTE